jgi:thioredoxin-dependent peroxiredoxin
MRTLLVALLAAMALPPMAARSLPDAVPAQRPLEVGDAAPDFRLTGSDGRTYQLADFRGKQTVVLAWFARAFSAG